MKPHQEGGYFKRTDTSEYKLPLPQDSKEQARAYASHIDYLLAFDDFSGFHRIDAEETWFHKEGGNLLIHVMGEDRKLKTVVLGDKYQGYPVVSEYKVPANHWFSVELQDASQYARVKCLVVPEFRKEGFQLADAGFKYQYPEHKDIIERLTRPEKNDAKLMEESKREAVEIITADSNLGMRM